MISRRTFVLGIGGAVVAMPRAAEAQREGRIPVVGILVSNPMASQIPGFIEAFRELGYQDGRNVRLAVRSAGTELDRLADLAAELANMKVDVIVSINTPPTRAAIKATKNIPIVMFTGDPIANGLVSNLAHPGLNVTGVTALGAELTGKRLQLLKEVVPAVRRIAVLFNPDDPVTGPQISAAERAASEIGIEVRLFPVRSQDSLTAAFAALTGWHADGVFWLAGQAAPFIRPTIDFAADHRLPTMMVWPEQVRAGGLLAYSPDIIEEYHRGAVLVDKILKGAKPSDLPVERPTKFGLAINLKTARALGLTIPPSILARADEVIQ